MANSLVIREKALTLPHINNLNIEIMLTQAQETQLNDFNTAKALAFTMDKGFYRRPSVESHYCGYQSTSGIFYVIGDSENEIQNPDAIVNGKPAREVCEFGTTMHG